MRVELFDNVKSSRGVTRFQISASVSTQDPAEVDTGDPDNQKRHAQTRDTAAYRKAIREFEPRDLNRCEEARQRVGHHNRFNPAGDEPEALLSHFVAFTKVCGTVSHRHQLCEMYWHDRVVDEDTGRRMICPTVHLYLDQPEPLIIDLKSMLKEGRSKRASKFVAHYERADYIAYKTTDDYKAKQRAKRARR